MLGLLDGKLRECLCALLFASSLLFTHVATASSFSPYQVYSVTPWPSGWPDAVAVGDFNGDGRKDVVLVTTSSQHEFGPAPDDYALFIFLQNSAGELAPPIKLNYSSFAEEGNDTIGYTKVTAIVVADFNRDGSDDIVVGRRFGLGVVLGRKDSQFALNLAECASVPCGQEAMAAMDVDGDGYLDVVAQNQWGTKNHGTTGVYGLTVYFGAEALFKTQRFLASRSEGRTNLAVSDINADGHSDVVLSWLGPGAEVFLADGEGWLLPGEYVPGPADPIFGVLAMAVGDFDRDHLPDIAIGGYSGLFDGRGFYMLKNLGAGVFQSAIQLPAAAPADDSEIPDKAVVADFNGDRYDDIVVLRSGGDIGYYEQGPIGLRPEVIYPGPYMTWADSQHSIAVGDINNDGCRDVVAANYNEGLVVWRAQGCQSYVRINGSQARVPGVHAIGNPHIPQKSIVMRAGPLAGAEAAAPAPTTLLDERLDAGLSQRFVFLLKVALGLGFACFFWWRWW